MELEEMLAKAIENILAKQQAETQAQAPEMVSKADVEAQFATYKAEVATLITETVAKAFGELSREGVGRKGTVLSEEEQAEKDPIAYLVKKAQGRSFEEMDIRERRAVANLTLAALTDGMKE